MYKRKKEIQQTILQNRKTIEKEIAELPIKILRKQSHIPLNSIINQLDNIAHGIDASTYVFCFLQLYATNYDDFFIYVSEGTRKLIKFDDSNLARLTDSLYTLSEYILKNKLKFHHTGIFRCISPKKGDKIMYSEVKDDIINLCKNTF